MQSMENIVPMEAPPQRLTLSGAERVAVSRLLLDGGEAVATQVSERASALANDPQVRRRVLARAVAVAEAQQGQLSAVLADAVARRDEQAAHLADRLLAGATKRLCQLTAELRAEMSGGSRSVVLVNNASEVNVHVP